MNEVKALNLLLLPLLGGFIFLSRWHLSRFFILRADGYRILFHSAAAGIFLAALSAAIIVVLKKSPEPLLGYVIQFDNTWHAIAPFDYSGVSALSIVLGSTLWFPMNALILDRNFMMDNVLQRKGDPLEILLRRAMGEGKLVLLVLKNDQIYIGYITSNFNPIFQVNFLNLLPLLTGCLSDQAGISFTACYANALEQYHLSGLKQVESLIAEKTVGTSKKERRERETVIKSVERELQIKDLAVAIPVDEILSAKLFTDSDLVIHLNSYNIKTNKPL